jgi:hypothetical protein
MTTFARGTRRMGWTLVLGFSLAACSNAVTLPSSELPVTLTQTRFDVPPPIIPLNAFGDAVVATTVRVPVCGSAQADATLHGERILVTLTITRMVAQACMVISGVLMYRAVVSAVPPGTYRVDLRSPHGGGSRSRRLDDREHRRDGSVVAKDANGGGMAGSTGSVIPSISTMSLRSSCLPLGSFAAEKECNRGAVVESPSVAESGGTNALVRRRARDSNPQVLADASRQVPG